MGGNALNLHHRFEGYGPIAHRSIDIGFRATKYTECAGNWIFEYTQRVYALNFPDYANLLRVSFIYPYPL